MSYFSNAVKIIKHKTNIYSSIISTKLHCKLRTYSYTNTSYLCTQAEICLVGNSVQVCGHQALNQTNMKMYVKHLLFYYYYYYFLNYFSVAFFFTFNILPLVEVRWFVLN